ncbi:hypothetical protein H7849_19790 [Alloacidobacterium dinghuense]|uniref:Secreted protein n=1 Tax=Alloacidobacterium dinghuense TaxID=2763107 RepID=A0A7G8BFJ1_9BACT|nr:hypothetical protein [Alloacidobacterium dinghuense]QNI31311.1 hypothetical protein H7849_19790 [Alloacidobacterium dinghuense]
MNTPRTSVWLASIVLGTALMAAPAELAFGSTSASGAQEAASVNTHPIAGPNRPANVPDGYVITPFGYFHASCVRSLVKGERLMADGRLQHADGSIDEKAAVCSYPHYQRNGVSSAGNTSTSPEINGWVENANFTTGTPSKTYGSLVSGWIVPPQPAANDGQVLYFFPGFEDINDPQTSILQPVLGWYQGQWTIASWNCCLNGITTNSPAVSVSPGDLIYGSITSNCGAGSVLCSGWNVLSVDLSTGQSTILANTPSDGQAFNWAFGGVLEAYSIVRCEDYPSDRRLTFETVVFNQDLNPILDPKWGKAVNNNGTPQCNYGVKPDRLKVTVDY